MTVLLSLHLLCLLLHGLLWSMGREHISPLGILALALAPCFSVLIPKCQERTLIVKPCATQWWPGVGLPHTNTADPTVTVYLK